MRPELAPLPPRLALLAIDERGYPVPWFVAWVDGKPEFRAADAAKWTRAVRDRLCWMCGAPLGKWLTFVLGPMCAVNRTTAEPPCHTECARYAAANCPFLTRPQMTRREDECFNPQVHASEGPGDPILRNPGVTLLWTTQRYRVFFDAKRRPLISIGDAASVEWYAAGRVATRLEVDASIESGLPLLRAAAELDGMPALLELATRAAAVRDLYPE